MSSAGADGQLERLQVLDAHLSGPDSPLRLEGRGVGRPEGWFLGPKAENKQLLTQLVMEAIQWHCDYRCAFHPEDPVYITEDVKQTQDYKDAVKNLEDHARQLFERLRLSAPIFSMRHQGHMLWDQVLPAIVGYFGAMLYNQNNVAAEASPVTTRLEIEVGNDLCRMLGFQVPPDGGSNPLGTPVPWGHITCGGSVANIEGLWAARNAKFFPLALRAALLEETALEPARHLPVRLLDGNKARLIDVQDAWILLNLKIDDVVSLPQTMKDEYDIELATTTAALGPYSVQNIGPIEFYRRFLPEVRAPVAMAPSTRHYSWPKAGALLGLGQNNILAVPVDLQARMDVTHLRSMLQTCLEKRTPVIAVVAVIGSTEESAVDPLTEILKVRKDFRDKGLDFAIHCDAAWGGYFNSMLRADTREDEMRIMAVPILEMSPYVREQYQALREADSITVDSHKAGYVPYPAGSVCYRNSAMRDLIALAAPVVFHSQSEPTVGIYGVEGSKPGAAAAAVWLAHKVIRPTRSGYGKILGQCMWTSKRLYCRLVTMKARWFKITLFQKLPAERSTNPSQAEIEREKEYIRRHFVDCTNEELEALLERERDARELFMELGSDQVILAYSFNFVEKSGALNKDAEKLNTLNRRVFEICSVTTPTRDLNSKQLIVTSSDFDPRVYGQEFVNHYCYRLGVTPVGGLRINFLISTTMNPWITDTPKGDFLVEIEKALRGAVHQALDDLEF